MEDKFKINRYKTRKRIDVSKMFKWMFEPKLEEIRSELPLLAGQIFAVDGDVQYTAKEGDFLMLPPAEPNEGDDFFVCTRQVIDTEEI